jgi:hypothetical protein
MYYSYEIYTKHPQTLEPGWGIETGWIEIDHVSIVGTCRETAIRTLRTQFPLFDTVITLYEANPNPDDLENDTLLVA